MTDIIKCGVPQGSTLWLFLFLMYINDLCQVWEFCFPLLFADDTSLFITGNETAEMCAKLNDDLKRIPEWLCCNKLSLNVSNTHYMVFSPRSWNISNLDARINNTAIERVYDTKLLGVQIDAQLSWKKHIEYTYNKLSKSVGIILKARKKLHKPLLLHYTFHFLIRISYIVILCRETPILPVWKKSQSFAEKIVRIITSSPYRAHTVPLLLANRLLSVTEINSYMVCRFAYNYINGILPTTFSEYFERNRNVHHCNTRQADDLRVPFARLNVRKFNMKIHGAQVWNSSPQYIKSAMSINYFKTKLRNFLIDKNIHIAVTQYQCWHRGIMHSW